MFESATIQNKVVMDCPYPYSKMNLNELRREIRPIFGAIAAVDQKL